MTVLETKRALRERMIAVRGALPREANSGASVAGRIVVAIRDRLARMPRPVVSAFWPIGDEIDVSLLIDRVLAYGSMLALPVVVAKGRPLVFRRWARGEPLETGVFGTRAPGADAEQLVPDIVVTPFLAADATGHRLGYGAGYYDMTLRELRRRSPRILAIGVGYEAQIVDAVPVTERDERLDLVVTERRTMVAPRPGKI